MTPSEQWILGLVAVYAIPSFLLGVGVTLLAMRLWDRRRPVVPNFLSPDRTFAPRGDDQPDMPAEHLQIAI